MATGYGEFAKTARQGSMTPQQWNAYLMQQDRVRTAYKQAFTQLQSAAQQEGLNIAPPELSNNASQAEAQEKLKAYADQVNQNLSYFDVDVQLDTAYKNAAANGLNIPRPTQYGKTVKDEATAKVILDNYTKRINQAALQKNLTNAVNNIRAQAAQQGVTLQGLSPNAYVGLTEARAQFFVDNYLKNANNQIAVKSYNDAVNSISAQAKAQGISVSAPSATAVNSANVQNMIDQYAASVNSALLQKSVSSAIDSINVQAKSQGVEVSKPSLSGVNQANAQSVVDNYLTKVNKAIESKAVATKVVAAPTASPAKSVTKVSAPTAAQVSTSTPSYIVYDDIGREQTITQSQLQQLQKAQQNRTWRENYTVVPEEVANSRANWWINSNGLFEWVPVTAADKKKLADRNAYYSRFGQSPKTTLTLGASPSEEYSKEWYRTGGNYNKAPVGSGDIKLQKIKANTAGINGTIKKVSTAEYNAKYHPGQIQLKNGTWIDQIQKVGGNTGTGSIKVYSSMEALNKERIETRKEAAEALKEAQKIRDAYIPVEISKNRYVDAVQMKGGIPGKGEDVATVQKREIIKTKTKDGEITEIKILASSGTAKEYAQALNNAKKLAAVPITVGMSKADQNTILQAREYYNSRAEKAINFSPQGEKAALVETKIVDLVKTLDNLSKPGTLGQKHADSLKEIATNKKSFKEDIATGLTPYLEGGKKAIAVMDAGLSLESVAYPFLETTRRLNKSVEKKYGASKATQGIDKTVTKAQKNGFKTVDNAVVTFFEKSADYSPLAILNNYAKKTRGESGWTESADLLTGVAKAVPTNIYKGVRENPASTALSAAAMYGTGAVMGGALGAGKSAVVSTIETAVINPKMKSTLQTLTALAEGTVQGTMAIGIGKEAVSTVKTGDANKIADFATEFVIGGAGFAKGAGHFNKKLVAQYGDSVVNSYNPLSRLSKIAGESTGLVRGQTVAVENAPYHPVESQAALIEVIVGKETISGTRGTAVHRFLQPVSGEPIGIKTFRIPGIKDKQFTQGTTLRALTGIKQQTLTRFRTEGGTAKDQANIYAADVYSSYMVPDLTGNKFQAVGIHFLQKGGKSRINQEVQLLEDIPTVASELSALQKLQIREQFAKEGKLEPSLLHEVQRLAAEKSKRIGQPVATITPKTAAGWSKPESEVLLVFGDARSTQVTSSKKVGFTASGIKIKKLRYGTQEAIKGELSVLENLKYNWENRLSGNDKYAEGMAASINRKIAEETGKAFMKPGQYGAHGVKHTGRVAELMADLWYKSPTLQKKYTLKEFEIAGRLHDSARIYGNSKMGETEPLAHGPAVAYNIRKGRIKDAELEALPRESQLRVAAAIETHMWLKPTSKLQALAYRASDMQKALKSADSIARAEGAMLKALKKNPNASQNINDYLYKGSTFKLPEERLSYKLKTSMASGLREFNSNTVAEFMPRKALTEVAKLEKIKVSENIKKPKVRQTSVKTEKTKKITADEYKYNSRKAKILGVGAYSYTAKKASASIMGGYGPKKQSSSIAGVYNLKKQSSGKVKPYIETDKNRSKTIGYKQKEKPEGYKGNDKAAYNRKDYTTNSKYTTVYPGKKDGYSVNGIKYPTTGSKYPAQGSDYKTGNTQYKTPGSKYQKPTPKNHITEYSKTNGKGRMIPPIEQKPVPPKRERKEEKKAVKSVKDLARFTRKIQNQFGNLDTMFGSSTAKTIRKTTKRARRA